MGIQVGWDDEQKRIIRHIFAKHWTWDDFYAAREQAFRLLDTVSHEVGVIMDLPQDVILPPNLLTHIRSALRNKHPNTIIIVFVLTTPLLRTMLTTLKSIFYLAPVSLEHAPTLDEARAIVYKRLAHLWRRRYGMTG